MKQFYKWINLSCTVWRCVESCHRSFCFCYCLVIGVHVHFFETASFLVSMRSYWCGECKQESTTTTTKTHTNTHTQKQAKTHTKNQFYLIYLFIHLLLLLIMPIRQNEAKETKRSKQKKLCEKFYDKTSFVCAYFSVLIILLVFFLFIFIFFW